jgi:crossover junction endodeoxyribonuclease RuvC
VEKRNGSMICIDAGSISSPARIPFYERIHKIFQSMVEIMNHYRPDEMALEDLFFAKNVKSSLKLGHARGAVLIAAAQCRVKIFEYTPLEIKKSVVGYGRATKEQIRSMVQVILKLKAPFASDTSDALAAAICHLNWVRFV